jgi:DNA-binding HxlR family transcriptional regulator
MDSDGRSSASPPAKGCPVGDLFAMLGQPHMLGILHSFDGRRGRPIRFGDLQRQLRISPKTLSQRLKTLVEAGLLTRRAYSEIPPRVEYEPTPKTTELERLFEVLGEWAHRHTLTAVPSVTVVGRVSR